MYQNIRAKSDSKIPSTLDYNSNGNGDSSEVDSFFQGVYDNTVVDVKVEPVDLVTHSHRSTPDGSSSSSGSPIIMKRHASGGRESDSPGPSTLQITSVISGDDPSLSYEGSENTESNVPMSSDDMNHSSATLTELEEDAEEEELTDDHSCPGDKSHVEEILHETSSSFHSESNSGNQQNDGHHLHWEDIKVRTDVWNTYYLSAYSSRV